MTPRYENERRRRCWANSAGDVIQFLTNVLVILGEVACPHGVAKGSLEDKYIQDTIKRLFVFFDKHNFATSASIGAYFRLAFQVKNQIKPTIEFTAEDSLDIANIIHSVEPEADVAALLDKFINDNTSARNAHADLLKTLLFPDIEHQLFINAKDKWNDTVNNFVLSAFYVVEFLNTPFSILDMEHQASPNKQISAIDLQFKTAKNALLGAVNSITNPEVFTSALKLMHSKTQRVLSSKTSEALIEIKIDLAKFQGCFGIEEERHRYEELATESNELRERLARAHREIQELREAVSLIHSSPSNHEIHVDSREQNNPNQHDNNLVPTISPHELVLKTRFLADLDKRIKELEKKKYGSVVKRAAKIVALGHLKDAVTLYMNTASLEHQLQQFNQIYGQIIDEQLRQGFWARIYTPARTSTREFIDKYLSLLQNSQIQLNSH